MKAYCDNCEALSPAHFRPGNDAESGMPYEDICCETCHWIIASITEREGSADGDGVTVAPGEPKPAQDADVSTNQVLRVEEDRRAVLRLLYEAHDREPCGPTLEAITAAIQHLQAVDAATGESATPLMPGGK